MRCNTWFFLVGLVSTLSASALADGPMVQASNPIPVLRGVLIGHPQLNGGVRPHARVHAAYLGATGVELAPCDHRADVALIDVDVDLGAGAPLPLPAGRWCGLTFAEGAELSADLDVDEGTLWLEAALPPFSVALPEPVTASAGQAAPTLELRAGAWVNLLPAEVAEGADLVLLPDSPLVQQLGSQIAASLTLGP